MKNRLRSSLATLLLITMSGTQAAELPKDSLRGLQLEYKPVESAERRPGLQMLLEVRAFPGDDFALRLPFRPNRFTPVVSQGSSVTSGAVLARIAGPELKAWLVHARATERRYEDAERRYTENRALYEQQALDGSTWTAIVERFYALQAAMHHVEHTLEILQILSGEESAQLLAPRDGHVTFPGFADQAGNEVEIARISEPGTLRLTGLLAEDSVNSLVELDVGGCLVPVSHAEARVEQFSRRVWSVSLPECLPREPGSLFQGRLLHRFNGFAVPRSSMVTVEGETGVFLDRGAALEFAPVQIVSASRTAYFVTGDARLSSSRVLVSSVSAVQGIILGLGRN